MTTKDRARLARLTPEIETVFDIYAEVFAKDLSGGKHMDAKMDIHLNKDIAKFMRGRYGIDARRPPALLPTTATGSTSVSQESTTALHVFAI